MCRASVLFMGLVLTVLAFGPTLIAFFASTMMARATLRVTTSDGLLGKPKDRGPFQRIPVITKATFDRLG
jgi:hypothetical protein